VLIIGQDNVLNNQKFLADEPVRDLIHKFEKFKMMRISLKKGLVVEKHAGTHPVFFLVLKGRGIFTTGKGDFELAENDYVSLEKEEPRGIKSLEDLVILGVRD
jgi:quercetin dioxygenase-like cupin family protein